MYCPINIYGLSFKLNYSTKISIILSVIKLVISSWLRQAVMYSSIVTFPSLF